MKILQTIALDFGRDTLPITVFAKQHDKESRFIEITPLSCGQKLALDNNLTARLELTKPDGYSVVNNQSIKDGIISVELTEQILAVAGTATAEIGLYKDDMRVSSQVFYLDIQKSACDENKIESSDEFTSFADSLKKATEAAKNVQNLVDDITKKLENGELKGEKGDRGEQGSQGVQGANGNDGVSPTVSVEKIDGGNRVTFTDTEGKKSFDVLNGEDGKPYELTDEDKHDIADIAVENASEAAKKANEATESAQNLVDDITKKLENGEFKGEKGDRGEQGLQGVKGEQGVQGERGEKGEKGVQGERGEKGEQGANGNDGVSPTVSVKKIDGGNRVTFTDTEGKKSFDVLNGEDGAGGTVTYKIPKECYQTLFADDNYSDLDTLNDTLGMVVIDCGKITLPEKKIEEDIEAGIIELPENFEELPIAEQNTIYCEIYEKFAKYDLKPWLPPRKAEHSWVWEIGTGENFQLNQDDGSLVCPNVALLWTDSFKMLLKAECNEIENCKTFAFSSNDYITNSFLSFAAVDIMQAVSYNNMFPFFVVELNENEKTGDIEAILKFAFVGLMPQYLIATVLNNNGDPIIYVKNDDVKEITISFMPNNRFVEGYENE